MTQALSFNSLTDALASVFDAQQDKRQPGKVNYRLSDAGLAAFAVFFTQSPSFFAYQRDMEKRRGKSNAQTLFGMKKIPTDTHIRNLLDPVDAETLSVLFRHTFNALSKAEVVKKFQTETGQLLLAIDGTTHNSSEKIHCESCSRREAKNGKIRYSHSVITPVVVSPEQTEVLSLEPAFVLPQDGAQKQDSEIKAAKRWLKEQAPHYGLARAVLLGDDLYCHQPWCKALLDRQLNFILVCKPESHSTLYQYLGLYPPEEVRLNHWNGRCRELHHYRFANGLPLRDGADALLVNWCELSIYREDTGELLFRNSFATDLLITVENLSSIVKWGRCRWKIENENNNVLKTKGYNFEHNYGHGKAHLSTVLLSLLLFAFLCHTVFALTLPAYQRVRKALGARRTFFNDVRALTRYHLFVSWYQLLEFMMEGLELSLDTS